MNHKQQLDNIDTKISSTIIQRTDSNNLSLNPEGNEIFAMSNKLNNSLAVPLTPIGCNKINLNQNTSNNTSSGNLFGKYLMKKKMNMNKGHSLSRATSTSNINNHKLEGVTPTDTSSNFLMTSDLVLDNDRSFSQSNLDFNPSSSNYYYYNSNSALSRGNIVDDDLDLDMDFTSKDNDLLYYPQDIGNVDDTLKNIYKTNKETSKKEDYDEMNYTINPMITQINPKHFSSPEYNMDDINELIQEAENTLPTDLNTLSSTPSTSYTGNTQNNAIPSKSVSDYNIFIKGEDGIELPAQEVLKKLNFDFSDNTKNLSAQNAFKKNIMDSVKLPSKNLKQKDSNTSKFSSKPLEVATELLKKSKSKVQDSSIISSLKAELLLKDEKSKSNIGLEEFKCEHSACKKSFSRPYDLVRHTKTIHSKQKKLYRCLICIKELGEVEGHKKTFSRGDALSRHIKLKHELKIGDESLRFAMKFAKDNVEYVEN
ncbi:hypothetical protein FOG50_03790 [Hanseniaspora uvarum]|nr:hypothetical protein FOG50_03790 [Hanseniaspora uvarum]